MKLRTRLNLVLAGLTATFVVVLLAAQFESTRNSVQEEVEASNRIAAQLLGRLAAVYSRDGGPQVLLDFLDQLGRVRANEIVLRSANGDSLYHSPAATYKAGRAAPEWFGRLLAPLPARQVFPLASGLTLIVEAESSRSVLDAWDSMTQLLAFALVMLVVVNGAAFWIIDRALRPFPVIVKGLGRLQQGELAYRLPALAGSEARVIGSAFNRMAEAVEDKVQAERQARDAESRLEERREMAHVVEQRLEEERRLIAHELHDEFGQSVTAIRSLAVAIATQGGMRDPQMGEAAQLIADEAARLYDAMHGLIPRLAPLSLDTLGLAETLETLVRDWQRRYPAVTLRVQHHLAADLGSSVALAVYRVVQEGLINALRHSQATHVDISINADSARIVAKVSDDGVGLPPQWSRPGHFGLRGLAERVARLGGVFEVRNREPHGVGLRADIPLSVPT